jgi:predicted glycoside hydrolase/deacetylase ChbG (UPF0249 family)
MLTSYARPLALPGAEACRLPTTVGKKAKMMTKYLIMNADDFGLTEGVNRGIVDAHVRGVVSSASLMVDAPAVAEAVRLARECPALGVGLHFAATGERNALLDLNDVAAVEREWHRQYQRFCELLGRPPTHIDSHHHVHLRAHLRPLSHGWAGELDCPIRGLSGARYDGRFYGQWYDEKWRPHPGPEWVGVEHLEKMLRELPHGVTEVSCHPGYVTPELDSPYAAEREVELATLLDARVGVLIHRLGIKLINFASLPQAVCG